MADVLIGVINSFISAMSSALNTVVGFLPTSPFVDLSLPTIPYLSGLNWVMPFGFMVYTMSLWLVAMGIYLFVQVILRWGKVIE